MTPKPVVTASALALVLSACGGGGGGGGPVGSVVSDAVTGGGGGGSVSAAGQSTTGAIDSFGSVFVNGVKFETDDAEIIIDGERRSEDALSVGMVVTVQGEINDDGVTGNAQRILYDDDLTGPISRITVTADGDALLLEILGFSVIVERTGTRFDDVSFDTLAVNDVVEVSGFIGQGDRLRATRIERKSEFEPGRSEVELTGRVRGLAATTFTLGDLTVDFSAANLDDVDGATLQEGMLVEVEGTLDGDVITAREIEQEDGVAQAARFAEGDAVRLQGAVTDYLSNAEFRVMDTPVDASGASFVPADLTLLNGSVVQVNGRWDGSKLVAESVESRRGRIKVEAAVADVDAESGTISLQLFSGTIDVDVDEQTKFDDDTDRVDRMTLADIRAGDFLEVEANRLGDRLVATLIDRDDADDDLVRAPVESFIPGAEIQLLGVTYLIGDTEFEDADDTSLDADTFFNALEVGDLVQIEDARISDGIADEVEFEDRLLLEGEREFGCGFEDDSSSCDDDSLDDDSQDDDSLDDVSVDDESQDDSVADDTVDDDSLADDTLDDEQDDDIQEDDTVDDDTDDDGQ
jgi:hypothetical protein